LTAKTKDLGHELDGQEDVGRHATK